MVSLEISIQYQGKTYKRLVTEQDMGTLLHGRRFQVHSKGKMYTYAYKDGQWDSVSPGRLPVDIERQVIDVLDRLVKEKSHS